MKKFLIDLPTARIAALPVAYGTNYIQFEGTLYNLASAQIAGYEGGYWDFWKLENGALLLSLENRPDLLGDDGLVGVRVNTNGYDGRMSLDAACLALNIAAANLMMWVEADRVKFERETQSYKLAKLQWTQLQEYGYKHSEAAKIFAALD